MSLAYRIARANENRYYEQKEKYKNWLYNALVVIQEQKGFTDEELLEFADKELGISETQFYKIFNLVF